MKPTIFFALALLLMLSACGQAPTPEPTSMPTPDIVATTGALSATIVAATLTAMPTATNTSLPTETPTPLHPTETVTPTVTATSTSIPFQGTLAPAGLDGTLPVKKFLVENNTAETVKLFITGVSVPGEKPLYYEYEITGSFSFDIVWGNFDYLVFVGNRQFKGSFRINNYDKTVMRVYTNKVVITGP